MPNVGIRIKSYFKNDFDLHSQINYGFHKETLIDFVKGAIITLVNKVMVRESRKSIDIQRHSFKFDFGWHMTVTTF